MSTPAALTLEMLPDRYALWQIPQGTPLPDPAQVFSITCAGAERSIVSTEDAVPVEAHAARGYRCLRLCGEFSLEETGILARLSAPLARAGIPLFVVSTVLTDYLLLRERDIASARRALAAQGIHLLEQGRDTAP